MQTSVSHIVHWVVIQSLDGPSALDMEHHSFQGAYFYKTEQVTTGGLSYFQNVWRKM